MRVQFVENENGPERLVREAEIHFGDAPEMGPLMRMKLVGFSLWRSPEGEVYVTFPSRAFGTGSDRRYFDFLRGAEPGIEPTKRLKRWIIDEYYRQEGAGADPSPKE
jgi:hypothetical protein